jgi:drug/metabolite transporter (DMT)-like permease
MNRKQTIADLSLLALALAWGGTFVMVKDAVALIPVFTFLTLRFSVASITLAAAAGPHLRRLDRRALGLSILAGLLFAAGYGFQTIGLTTSGPGRVGFITGLAVVFVPIGAAVIWQRRPNRSAISGVICALAGLALLTGGLSGDPITAGDVWVLLGTIGFAGQILVVAVLPRRIDPRALAAVQLISTTIGSGLMLLLIEPPVWPTQLPVWGAVLFTGVVVSGLGVLVQTWAQTFTSATHTALILASEPVFAALFGFILIGERLAPAQTIGCGLILIGMLISELGPVWRRRQHPTLPL